MSLTRLLTSLACLLALVGALRATEYHVGPGQPLVDLAAAPWRTLMPGDTVFIHARPEPYKTKFVLARRGEPGRPIRVVGVPDAASGALPVIDGREAVMAPGLAYNSERSVIKIGAAGFSGAVESPSYIELENLDIGGARGGETFTHDQGAGKYRVNAAAVHIESGDHITLRNCILRDSSQGLSTAYLARDILVERCHIYNNGNPRSITEHNIYTESLRLTFLYNRLGPLPPGALGNNIKDRSAGLTVGWNWLEGGNRILDLVDTSHPELAQAPEYKHVRVFGNVMIKLEGGSSASQEAEANRQRRKQATELKAGELATTEERVPQENNQVVHYGGDSGDESMYRKGVLWFEQNTVISQRNGATLAFRLSTPKQFVIASNNLFSVGENPHDRLYFLHEEGYVHMAGPNYAHSDWREFSGEKNRLCRVLEHRNIITTTHPQFWDEAGGDYRLQKHTKAVGKAGPPLLANFNWPVATRIYKKHQAYEDLPAPHKNLGALPSTKSRSILGK